MYFEQDQLTIHLVFDHEYPYLQEFARSANMAYCEAAMRDNDLEIEKAIIVMIREKVLPPTTEVCFQ